MTVAPDAFHLAKGGTVIRSTEDWFGFGPPKGGEFQWRDGYSAKELANAWTDGAGAVFPSEVAALLETHTRTSGFIPTHGEPEVVTRLDGFRGEGRNHDLVVEGRAPAGEGTLLAVEGKALETFGQVLTDEVTASLPTASKKPQRLNMLAQALLGVGVVDVITRKVDPGLGSLRYQLFTAAVGAVIEAEQRGCARAVLVIHEFRPSSPNAEQHAALAQNGSDLDLREASRWSAYVGIAVRAIRAGPDRSRVRRSEAVHRQSHTASRLVISPARRRRESMASSARRCH